MGIRESLQFAKNVVVGCQRWIVGCLRWVVGWVAGFPRLVAGYAREVVICLEQHGQNLMIASYGWFSENVHPLLVSRRNFACFAIPFALLSIGFFFGVKSTQEWNGA